MSSSSSTPSKHDSETLEQPATQVSSTFRQFSHSSLPAFSLGGLFFASGLIPMTLQRKSYVPPFLQRVGFGVVLCGAGYILSQGDAENGSGVATAWSLTFSLLHLRKSLKSPRHPMSLALVGGTTACAALYGSEYFLLQS
ncbi:hypothetical protein JAAARDRAFT_27653 [Jaapia argillacea MUCL 33604]|uniref:Uncharacterized protein n=1 Tax=Jaapia argillacea MUCL 33604 TaxID=933084 RepID=A0A067QAL4_9AGAM|nr:hypothetical protein JAAARDRAFT_27653 [Jaapia argillacea MUCL 33604]